jgi:hypothetical protein
MSHDTTARKVFGVSLETVVRRILRTFDAASKSDVEHGARWYDEAGELAIELAARHGYSVEQTASVIAALSPRTTWSRNVAGAVLLLADDEILPGLIGRNVETAREAQQLGFDALNGPKTSRFARNIAGDRESVTVDVWAARVASLDEDLLGRKGAYDAIEHAYRLAARRRGVDPATMQATTWIVARNGRAA